MVIITGRTLWVLQIVLQNVKAIFIIKMVWKVIRLVNIVSPIIWQVYKSLSWDEKMKWWYTWSFKVMLRCVMEKWWILKPWQYTYNANLWSTYKWLVHSLKRMWLVISIVNARPFYKRIGQDVIKSLWVEYM